MMFAAGASEYYGFDLFESGTKEDDEREFNAKPRQHMELVSAYLQKLNISHELYRGDSKQTLPQFIKENPDLLVDFAFIDGGHSVETIQSDWEHVKQAVKPGGVVIFDDYYTDGPDISKVGCNKVVENLNHYVLPIADPVKGGGKVHLVKVTND